MTGNTDDVLIDMGNAKPIDLDALKEMFVKMGNFEAHASAFVDLRFNGGLPYSLIPMVVAGMETSAIITPNPVDPKTHLVIAIFAVPEMIDALQPSERTKTYDDIKKSAN